MIPVAGSWSARRPRTSGSTSRISSGPSSRSVTPFAAARSAIEARRGISASSVATISSPQISCGIACSSAKARASRFPSAQRRAFSEPGAYLLGEWITPLLRPVWCEASRSSFSRTTSRRPGRASSRRYAVARPTIPPPTTTRSARSVIDALAARGARIPASGAQAQPGEDLAPEGLDELGLVAADVVDVDLVEAHVDVVLDVRGVDREVRRDEDAIA